MEEYQERVLVEQKELSDKIVKLTTFLTDKDNLIKISNMEYEHLYEQLQIMLRYNFILLTRIRYIIIPEQSVSL